MLEYVLRHLGYVACDETTKLKVQDMMERGKTFLSQYDPGINWDEPNGTQKGLLKDYCLYEMSNALDDFRKNYGADLIDLHHDFLARSESADADNVQAEQK
ncbi:hypothetical protein [Faecalibaculum rodentium]|uniref:hypothetical protein n=1 Tax=Faecalibaculum rodentium TaxID=1702221 RepID=UPI00272D1F6B|nr:hypothetical protein [Faecalibaculum rodentium]